MLLVLGVSGVSLSPSVIPVRLVMLPMIPVIVQMFLMCCHCFPLKHDKRFYSLVSIYQKSYLEKVVASE